MDNNKWRAKTQEKKIDEENDKLQDCEWIEYPKNIPIGVGAAIKLSRMEDGSLRFTNK